VTARDLKDCGKNVCVMSSADCPSESDVLTATPGATALMSLTWVYPQICSWFSFNVHLCSLERFVNTSCHFLSHEESITCRWIQMNDVRTETFIFRR